MRNLRSSLIRYGWIVGPAVAIMTFVALVYSADELRVNVQSFPDGKIIRPGTAIVLSVEGLEPGQTATWHRVQSTGGTAIWVLSITTDGKAPPPPVDELGRRVAKLAEGLNGKPAVAKMFGAAIPRIESGELRGSGAIVQAVSEPIAALDVAGWQKFSRLLYEYLLNERKLVSQSQWAKAYTSVVAGLGGTEQ